MNDLLNQFQFPDVAMDEFINKGLNQRQLAPQVSAFEMAGHDKGVPYRFFTTEVTNKVKSEPFDVEIPDTIEMIEWYVSKKHKPTERVTMIGDKLLKFSKIKNPDGSKDCIGGAYKENYLNFKKGMTAPGLPLNRWDKLSSAEVFTLVSGGVFTVQQFAALPRDIITNRFPKHLHEKFEEAILFINGQKPMIDIHRYADEVLAARQEASKLKDEMAAMQEKMAALMEGQKRGKPGRKPKVKEETPVHVDN